MTGYDLAAEVVALLGLGLASALVPVVNAEAVVVTAAAAGRSWVLAATLLGVGQGVGKVAVFVGVRRGSRWAQRFRRRGGGRSRPRSRLGLRLALISQRLLGMLGRPVAGGVVVCASALVGVPPLLLVSVAAAVSTVPVKLFAVCVVGGRVLRFAVIAYPVASASA